MKARPESLALVVGGLLLAWWWVRNRQKTGAVTPAAPVSYSFSDVGADLIQEDDGDSIVKALLDNPLVNAGYKITYEDADRLLVIQQPRELYDQTIVAPWGGKRPTPQ